MGKAPISILLILEKKDPRKPEFTTGNKIEQEKNMFIFHLLGQGILEKEYISS